jgi:parvulin-like peptidyl-prolyl isomerase
VSWLLLHAKPVEADPDLDLTPAEAAEELRRYRAQVQSPEDFGRLAEKFSEHDPSRRRRGLYGSIHRHEPGADPLLCAAAFAQPLGEISEPVPVSGGVALLLVHAERAAPAAAELRELSRRARHDEARAEFVAGLDLRTIWDAEPQAADGAAGAESAD